METLKKRPAQSLPHSKISMIEYIIIIMLSFFFLAFSCLCLNIK
jgi:hypothetical protein